MTNDRQFVLIQRPNLAKCRWNPERTRSGEFQALSSKVPPRVRFQAAIQVEKPRLNVLIPCVPLLEIGSNDVDQFFGGLSGVLWRGTDKMYADVMLHQFPH